MNFPLPSTCLGTQTMYMAEPLYAHGVPCWMHHPSLYQEGQSLHWWHPPQRMVYPTGHFHSGYLEMAQAATFFHPPAPVHETYGATMPPASVVLSSQAHIGPQAYVPMHLQPVHAAPLQCHELQVSPALAHISHQMDDISIKPRLSEAAQYCIPSPLCFGDEAILDESFPEFTPLEEALRFFQCEPEAEKAQTPVEQELKEATVDMAVTADHGLDDDELKACILHLLQTLEPSNSTVTDTQLASSMDL